MKKYFLIAMLMTIVLSSCEEDKIIFDGSQTLVAFSSNTVDLPIEIDATGSVDITVNVTTLSTSERTFNVTVVEDETTAGASSYSFGSIVVPANAYNGTFTINGVDDNVTTTPEKLVLRINEGPDYVTETESLTVNVFQVCPVDEALFTGMYRIDEITPFLPFSGPTLDNGGIIEVTADGLTRVFNTVNFPNFCSNPIPFTFNLVCNETVVPVQNTNCACNTGTDWFGPSTSGHANYDPNDDSVFEVTFSNDVQNDCGSGPVQTTYRFTKQ
ncbi:hypothetical protein [Aquimarina sp. 2201CG5-10]|uniref:hypothetical protein n=1 Tax=Aquimarina callyspongiae TaxID=3098150 RepID=UPI002AB3A238|nr:hypothetical protein [Aquimarina sp. 2201CG5-10]MDY8134140.1 hypothetical protein [Aquimarina sp. 2201CG5-10]